MQTPLYSLNSRLQGYGYPSLNSLLLGYGNDEYADLQEKVTKNAKERREMREKFRRMVNALHGSGVEDEKEKKRRAALRKELLRIARSKENPPSRRGVKRGKDFLEEAEEDFDEADLDQDPYSESRYRRSKRAYRATERDLDLAKRREAIRRAPLKDITYGGVITDMDTAQVIDAYRRGKLKLETLPDEEADLVLEWVNYLKDQGVW